MRPAIDPSESRVAQKSDGELLTHYPRHRPKMTIKFACPMCSKSLAAGDDRAGRRVRCPSCNNAVTVPSPPTAESPEPDQNDLGFSELFPDKKALKSQLDKLTPGTRKALLIGGIAGTALLFGCCGIGIIGMIISESKKPTEASSAGEKLHESDLASFDETPPPVIDLVKGGVVVWEMTHCWLGGDNSSSNVDSSFYVAIRKWIAFMPSSMSRRARWQGLWEAMSGTSKEI